MSDINFSNIDDDTLEKIVSEIPNENNDFLKELNKRKEAKKVDEERNKKELEKKEKIAKGEIPFVWAVLTDTNVCRYINIEFGESIIKDFHNGRFYLFICHEIENHIKDVYNENVVDFNPLYIKPTDK